MSRRCRAPTSSPASATSPWRSPAQDRAASWPRSVSSARSAARCGSAAAPPSIATSRPMSPCCPGSQAVRWWTPGNLVGLNSSTLGRHGQLTVLAATIDATVTRCFSTAGSGAGILASARRRVRLPEALARALDNGQELGLLIVSVESGGPADTAGLMLGDVILAVDGAEVGQVEQLQEDWRRPRWQAPSRSGSRAVASRERSPSPSASASDKPNSAESTNMSMTLEPEQQLPQCASPPRAGALRGHRRHRRPQIKPSVVLVGQPGSHGAGVIWRSDGIVVTNRHVIRDDRVDVVLDDGRKFTGIVAARHPDRDLAVVKIAADRPAGGPARRFQHGAARSDRDRGRTPPGTTQRGHSRYRGRRRPSRHP